MNRRIVRDEDDLSGFLWDSLHDVRSFKTL